MKGAYKMAKPVMKFRNGSITLSVWGKAKEDGSMNYSFTIQKSYKTRDGEWKNTDFFWESEAGNIIAAGIMESTSAWTMFITLRDRLGASGHTAIEK